MLPSIENGHRNRLCLPKGGPPGLPPSARQRLRKWPPAAPHGQAQPPGALGSDRLRTENHGKIAGKTWEKNGDLEKITHFLKSVGKILGFLVGIVGILACQKMWGI